MAVKTLVRPFEANVFRGMAQAAPSTKFIPKTVRYSFLLFVFTIPFEDVALAYITSGTFSLAKLSGMCFLGFYLFHLGLPMKKRVPHIPNAMRCFLVYFFIWALSALVVAEETHGRILLRLFTLAQLIIFFWTAMDLLRQKSVATSCLLTFSLGCAIVALGTLLWIPGFVEAEEARIVAFGGNANTVAMLMGYAAIILISLALNETGWSLKLRAVILSLTGPLLLAMMAAASRGAIAAFVIGLFVFFVPARGSKRVAGVLMAAVTLGAVVYLGSTDELFSKRVMQTVEEGHTSGRGEIFGTALEMIAEKPILGWGPWLALEELGYELGSSGHLSAHNLILHLLLEVGLAGAIPFLMGVGLCVLSAWSARSGAFGYMPLALLTALLAFAVVGTALTNKVTWLIFALSLAAPFLTVKSRSRVQWKLISSQGLNKVQLQPR